MTRMPAARLLEFGADLAIVEAPVPAPRPGWVLVRVRAVGLCGTDLKLIDGKLPTTSLPVTPGHEVAGTVERAAEGFAAGQSVTSYIFDPCEQCSWCRRDEAILCPDAPRIGLERDGGLAEFISVRARNLLPFDGIGFTEAAVSMDAVLSPWRAVRVRADVQPGERVVVCGAGGLGIHAVQIAVGAGASVAVVDPVEARRAIAAELGAEAVFSPEDDQSLMAWSGEGADVALEMSGVRSAFDLAATVLRPGGRLVTCGYRPGTAASVDSMRLALDELVLMGSRGGSRADARQALDAVRAGLVRPLIAETGDLASVNERIARLRDGDGVGRQVVVMG